MPEHASSIRATIAGQEYFIEHPPSDSLRAALESVFAGTEYPLILPEEFRPSLILDVGANVGAASLWFHSAYPDAKIVAYEPSTSLFSYLEKNTASVPEIDVCNVGLSDQNGQQELRLATHSAAQHSLLDSPADGGRRETVFIRRASDELDSLGIDHVSILKIDTEGCEIAILADLGSWLDRIAAVYVEYHSEDDRRAIDQLMAEHFYLLHASVHHPNLGTLVFFAKSFAQRCPMFISPPLGN